MLLKIFYLVNNAMYIIEGYAKWLYDKVTGKMSTTAKDRYGVCQACEHNSNGVCDLCGCIIKAKVRVDFPLDSEGKSIDGCPERKW